jgi:hypothetical protein
MAAPMTTMIDPDEAAQSLATIAQVEQLSRARELAIGEEQSLILCGGAALALTLPCAFLPAATAMGTLLQQPIFGLLWVLVFLVGFGLFWLWQLRQPRLQKAKMQELSKGQIPLWTWLGLPIYVFVFGAITFAADDAFRGGFGRLANLAIGNLLINTMLAIFVWRARLSPIVFVFATAMVCAAWHWGSRAAFELNVAIGISTLMLMVGLVARFFRAKGCEFP